MTVQVKKWYMKVPSITEEAYRQTGMCEKETWSSKWYSDVSAEVNLLHFFP